VTQPVTTDAEAWWRALASEPREFWFRHVTGGLSPAQVVRSAYAAAMGEDHDAPPPP
jgi:hypothetical protein